MNQVPYELVRSAERWLALISARGAAVLTTSTIHRRPAFSLEERRELAGAVAAARLPPRQALKP